MIRLFVIFIAVMLFSTQSAVEIRLKKIIREPIQVVM